MRILYFVLLAWLCLGIGTSAFAQDYTLSIKDHRFTPDELTIPANTAVKLTVNNQDATPEEFESEDLGLEKIIPGNSQAVFNVRPQKPGTYIFFGEFNEATAKGKIIVK